jgi:hypothetical protein
MKQFTELFPMLLACLIVGLPLEGCALAQLPGYVAQAIEGRVVAADSGQPLEGVIVTVNWELVGGAHSYPVGQLYVAETLTDTQGRFSFSAWGPKSPLFAGHLHDLAPQLLFFKSDYNWERCVNEALSESNTSLVRSSDCNGKTFKLKRFTGTVKEYAESLGRLDAYLDNAFFFSHDCSWKQVPRMLVALDQEQKRLVEKRIPNRLRPIEYRDKGSNPAHCGSMRDHLRSYMP